MSEKDKKEAQASDVNQADAKMRHGMSMMGDVASGVESRQDLARSMVLGSASASSVDAGAFSKQGIAGSSLADVKELFSDESGEEASASPGTKHFETPEVVTPHKRKLEGEGAAATMSSSAKKAKPTTWFDRDTVVGSAVKSNEDWYKNTVAKVDTFIEEATETLSGIDDSTASEVRLEAQLCRSRFHAVKLVNANRTATEGCTVQSGSEPPAAGAAANTASAEADVGASLAALSCPDAMLKAIDNAEVEVAAAEKLVDAAQTAAATALATAPDDEQGKRNK